MLSSKKKELQAIRDRLRPDGWRIRVLSDCKTTFNIAESGVPLHQSQIFRLSLCPDGEWEIYPFFCTDGLLKIGIIYAVLAAVAQVREGVEA